MKILWVKAGPFLPLDTGGKIRTWNILRELAKLDEVTALSYSPSSAASPPEGIEHNLAKLIALRWPAPLKYSFAYSLDYLRRLLSPVPYSVRKNMTREIRQQICDLANNGQFDALVCDFLSSSLNMPERAPCPRVLFAHNLETMIWKRHFEVEQDLLRKVVMGIEYWKMKRFESRWAKKFDHVLTVSSVDRDTFTRFLPPDRVSVLPTGVDLDHFRPRGVAEIPGRLAFTGSMDWLPNEDAMLFFVREILPRVQQAYPGTTLGIVGRDPTPALRRLAQANPGVEVTGTVPDVRPYLAAAAVYVVPLRVGGGTRLKIYEAMAMGKAVVSTRIGAEGLLVRHGEHLLLADDPEDFAAAAVRLLQDAHLRRKLGDAAREFVHAHCGWPGVAKRFHDILAHVVEGSAGRRASGAGVSPPSPQPAAPARGD